MYLGSSGKSSQCLAGLKVAFTGNHNRLCDDDDMDTELIYIYMSALGVMERFISRESLQDLYLSHGAKVHPLLKCV
jgi:hypothetical protein